MIRDIRRKYFEVWGNEEAQNVFLKGILAALTTLFIIQSFVLSFLALRKPVLVAVGKSETQVFSVTPPPDELLSEELKRIVRRYAEIHYSWSSITINKAHEEAARYVAPEFVKAFKAANLEQIKIVQEKKLCQKVYVSEIFVDPPKLGARITMDRILTIEGLRAVSALTLDITFEYGSRTATNPEGIYITSEKVINS
jgi:hypothetical protein